jgi:hypothetical protein
MKEKWIGVDLDGTLAVDEGAHTALAVIGSPIPAMVERVKKWLAEGRDVRIFTARVYGVRDGITPELIRGKIEEWCLEHIGQKLPVTCEKDFGMGELWDDRAVQVVKNTGERVGSEWKRSHWSVALSLTLIALAEEIRYWAERVSNEAELKLLNDAFDALGESLKKEKDEKKIV